MRAPHCRTALALALFLLPAAAHAQAPAEEDREAATVTVLGEGEASGAPDLAMANLTVLRVAETAEAALSQANEAARAVAEAMGELGIEARDLQTGGFSITPQYRYENRQDGTSAPPELVGYEVRNTLAVRIRDLSRIGEVLDRAVSLGVNQGGDIAFQIEDPSSLRDEARREAVSRARESATIIAEAAGVTLGRVVSISDEAGPSIPRPMAEARMMAASADAGVPIQTGENTVRTQLRVVFELEDAQ
ncbi:SIMPL domain-containing protein [Aureimonas populi]|uniref:SIMPL domain-containing protein n=1 Tax=Aureimonas populi TaxID=1701758 RepID=A0ABW5CH27_9HYPH|nr:SIMPL domain-containing protein [Aureimonas populi]